MLAPRDVDLDVLYDTFKSLFTEKLAVSLELDYGGTAEYLDQYWVIWNGAEHFVTSPSSVPELVEWYHDLAKLPPIGGDIDQNSPLRQWGEPSGESAPDPFHKLPAELLQRILLILDLPDAYSLRKASRPAARLGLGNDFWRPKLRLDQPWLYDLPNFATDDFENGANWEALYKALARDSISRGASKLHNKLVNRRRIWNALLSGLLPLYESRKSLKSQTEPGQVPTLIDVSSTPSPRLILPTPTDVSSRTVLLLEEFGQLEEVTPTLVVSWAADGVLANIVVQGSSDSNSPTEDDEHSSTEDKVEIAADDWLIGIVLTSQAEYSDGDSACREIVGVKLLFSHGQSRQLGKAEGDQRVTLVSSGSFAVGFTIARTAGGVLARLALLQQPVFKISLQAYGRITASANTDERVLTRSATRYLWKGQIYPPAGCSVYEAQSGYWSYDIQPDLCPMEALVFGSCDEELSRITAFSADAKMGGFQVHYIDGSVRSIGPRCNAMQTIDIDGKGGERIVRMYLRVNHIPLGLRFVTNRGRQLIVGQSGPREVKFPQGTLDEIGDAGNNDGTGSPNAGQQDDIEGDVGEDTIFLGISFYWTSRRTPKSRLDLVSAFGRPFTNLNDRVPVLATAKDADGHHWQGRGPPDSVVEDGPIHGLRFVEDGMGRITVIPGETSIVSYLDCSRPVESVSSTLCHRTNSPQIPLCALSLKYSDGSAASFGPTSFYPPEDTSGTNGYPWCWCTYGSTPKRELERGPHYTHEDWKMDGSHLAACRVWLDEDNCLIGLRFIKEGEEDSLLRESAGRGNFTDIPFRTSEQDGAVGLKFFLQYDDRHVTYEDITVTAVQAMVHRRV